MATAEQRLQEAYQKYSEAKAAGNLEQAEKIKAYGEQLRQSMVAQPETAQAVSTVAPYQQPRSPVSPNKDYKQKVAGLGQAVGRIIGDEGSARDSATKGFQQGATFGFADEWQGVVGAGLEAVGNGDFNLIDNYKTYRDLGRERYSKAQEADPDAYFAGELGSIVVPGTIGGKAAKTAYKGTNSLTRAKRMPAIVNATKSGAKTGAVYGLGTGEGDFIDQAISTAEGATTGAVLAGGLSSFGATLGRIKDKKMKPKGDTQKRLFSRIKHEFDNSPQLDIRDIDHAKTVVNNIKVKMNGEIDDLLDNAVSSQGLPKSTLATAKKLLKNKNNSLSDDVADELEGLLGKEHFGGLKKVIDETNEMNALFAHTGKLQDGNTYNATILKTPGRYLYQRALMRYGGNPHQNQMAQVYRGTKKVSEFGKEAAEAKASMQSRYAKQIAAQVKQKETQQASQVLNQKLANSQTSNLPQGGWKGATWKNLDKPLQQHVTREMLDEAIEKSIQNAPKEIQAELIEAVAKGKPPSQFMYNVTDELSTLVSKKVKAPRPMQFPSRLSKVKSSGKLTDATGAPIRDIRAYGEAATRNQALNKLGYTTR